MLRIIFLLLAVLHFYYTLYYDWFYIILPEQNDAHPWFRPSKFKFLTFWNVILQAIFFTICLAAHVIAGNNRKHVLRRIQNRLMVSLVYPMAIFVFTTFWAIYLIDRELILPKALDEFFPAWMNHCMHTNILVFMLMEFFTSTYIYAPRAKNLKILCSLIISYLIWLLTIFGITGMWVYPILNVLPWPLKIAFLATTLSAAVGLYFTGELLNKCIQRNEPHDESRTTGKRESGKEK